MAEGTPNHAIGWPQEELSLVQKWSNASLRLCRTSVESELESYGTTELQLWRTTKNNCVFRKAVIYKTPSQQQTGATTFLFATIWPTDLIPFFLKKCQRTCVSLQLESNWQLFG